MCTLFFLAEINHINKNVKGIIIKINDATPPQLAIVKADKSPNNKENTINFCLGKMYLTYGVNSA